MTLDLQALVLGGWRACARAALMGAVMIILCVGAAEGQLRYETRTVAVFNQLLYFGSMAVPRALSFDTKHAELWIADGAADRISVFTRDGQELYSFAAKAPSRIVAAPDGNVAVIGGDRTRVLLFNYRGEFLHHLPLGKIGAKPTIGAVAFDSDGNAIVADNASSQVFIVRSDGSVKLQFGSNGSDEGQFLSVCAIAIDRSGQIIIADQRAVSIQVFDAQGNFVRGWGKHEMGAENFSLPSGLALDSVGRIYVSDELRHQVKIFTPSGKLLLQFGGLGRGAGDLSFPTDVAIDAADRVYVAERGNGRIQAFEVRITGDEAGPRAPE